MVKTYRTIQQWDHWLTQSLGALVLSSEQRFLSSVLPRYYGKHALLIGVPRQSSMLQASAMLNHVVLSPLSHFPNDIQCVEGEFYKLPIASGSVDLVILPHTLEFVDNQRHLLTEACRLVKPEGLLMVLGFNPSSLWGLKKWWAKSEKMPWSGQFTSPNLIKKWVSLADFELVKQDMLLFSLPFKQESLFNRFQWLETIGKYLVPFLGGVYALTFQAKVIPLTPIKMHWKQTVSAISTTIPRPTMRDMQ